MKISTQASTFLVLVAAILGMGLYVNSIDIDTTTSTVEETLLPREYTDGELANIKGFSFRYPVGWQTSTLGDVITLSSPQTDDLLAYDFTLTLSEDTDSQPVDLLEIEGEANAESITRPAGQSQRNISVNSGLVAVQEVMRLSDEVLVDIRTAQPIPETDWDTLKTDYDRIVNSIKNADIRVLREAFTYEIPEGWTPGQITPYQVFATNTTEQGQNPERVVLTIVLPQETMTGYLSSRQFIPPGLLDPAAGNPVAMVQAVVADDAAGVVQGGTDVEYLGFSGSEMIVEPGPDVFISVAVVDAEDGNYIAVITQKTGDDATGIQELLDSMTYTKPDPSVFDALGQ